MKRKALSLMICLVLLVSLLPQNIVLASTTIVASGTCGDNLTWTLDDEGTLTVSGSGEMWDYYDAYTPWRLQRNNIKKIEIGCDVTTIGAHAFSYCDRAENLTIPNEITCIGEGAFLGCDSIVDDLIIPGSVKNIGNDVFAYCENVSNVTICEGVTDIPDGMFRNCKNLKTITIPQSVISIGYAAFFQCAIESIELPDGLEYIGGSAFSLCNSLGSIVIPKNVKYIGFNAFEQCLSLADIQVEEGNAEFCSIDGVLFNSGVTEIIRFPAKKGGVPVLPDSVDTIGRDSFDSCNSIEDFVIPKNVTNVGDVAFANCENLKSVTIIGNISEIKNSVFSGCKSLETITIPNSVTSIDNLAFSGCRNLARITIPQSVTYIASNAFYNCKSLATIFGYAGSYAEVYAIEKSISFVEIPPTSYSFGQSVQIGLIEPWFLKANARVYTDAHPTNIDYSSLVDYGAYFIRASALSDKNATQESLAVEDIINNPASSKYSKSAGTATVDGSYITANYDKGLYTYELDDSVFVLFYVIDDAGITYAPIRERNLKSLLEARCNDVANFPNELERAVYKNMLAMFDAISAYRDDYFSKN